MSEPWLEGLNEQQREAVKHGDGPLLIIAGAGTGKTRTLASRVAELLHRGVSPERILLLTFTRRAALEMISRADQQTGLKVSSRVWGGTFHAVSNRLLRIYGRALGLPDGFTVMDQGDAADMMSLIRNELGAAKEKKRFPNKNTIVAIYSRTVNSQDKLVDVLDLHFPWCREFEKELIAIFDLYVDRKRANNLMDYDDLLLHWKLMCDVPGVGERVAGRFDHILVDEYQDTNVVQADILVGMRRRNNNICVVGDDAQSIYSFRAATIRNILDFPQRFPGTRIIALEQNYRSIQPILDLSNAVMEPARERYTKNLWSTRTAERRPVLYYCMDEDEQSRLVCERILEHLEQGVPLRQQAVLFRAGHHSDALEVELMQRRIPFRKFGGLKFIESAHIKDMLAFLRVLENPHDEISWFRILCMMRGMGPQSARRVMQQLGVRRQSPAQGDEQEASGEMGSPLSRFWSYNLKVPPDSKKSIADLREALKACYGVVNVDEESDEAQSIVATGSAPTLAVQIQRLREYYEPIFKTIYDNWQIRIRDIEQLEQIAGRFRSRRRFVADLTLDPPNSTADLAGPPCLDDDYLILSTMHSAKGCEWTSVHIIHAADGMIPSDMATRDESQIDEERRLFYVALTRAKDWLYIYFPLRYYRTRYPAGDAHSIAQLTRFLPKKALALLEKRSDSPPGFVDDELPPGGRSHIDAQLKKRWRS
ncbi:MAG TPA: ATP-dependent helicase [Phycisphaerae bacterium]|nr:ATP-dependent helicase [Phycisphaerae bacterium]HRR84735.1 ATP-dependent helicase [Phycisphaerae bacterium]